MFFTNTLSGNKELFISQRPERALLYSCGPTVYGSAHIGNLRAYVFSDTLARMLGAAGYQVRRVINITDVGHLVGDGDTGEDKMNVGAEREKTTPQAIADRYTKEFIEDLSELNVDTKDIQFPRATDYIKEQIALAKTLEEKGFAYRIKNGLAFDTSRFRGYGKLGNIDLSAQRIGARIETDQEKRNPADFWLWRIAKPNDLQQWDSPWGRGNPGWHIECSAMSRALLGQEIDIHTGGEDHIATHHNNEIAQSEAASGRTFVHYWMHNAFLTVEGQKISKSLRNDIYLKDIIANGRHPLALRYFYLQAHYRTPLSFSWDALAGAASALERLWKISRDIADESGRKKASGETRERFLATMRDDLATPAALGILWDSLKSEEYTPEEKWGLLEDADAHLGISLINPPILGAIKESDIPQEIREMLARRSAARASKDFKTADKIRVEIEKSGYHVDDGPSGAVLTMRTL
ncbi:MAG: cysteine--tRNA ligase [Candidatus Zambryskibacteria bacterium RIFCSPHIGHO2_01_FULL_49_18]|uniref:Cysteine--tRNA ligase n=1 Tax=Candidatus Zambryskibacteria bacterium RIFCSPHIGHO2_01_FULL_49_18 TaxID=1802740 RepID=A0A1G2T554_9BACT|nr:MAG: cysteine--tRNA ligase [Candidatus Zambryskibacteria bacterium RIFCSPHIGHO2_01_FULL_49_18]